MTTIYRSYKEIPANFVPYYTQVECCIEYEQTQENLVFLTKKGKYWEYPTALITPYAGGARNVMLDALKPLIGNPPRPLQELGTCYLVHDDNTSVAVVRYLLMIPQCIEAIALTSTYSCHAWMSREKLLQEPLAPGLRERILLTDT